VGGGLSKCAGSVSVRKGEGKLGLVCVYVLVVVNIAQAHVIDNA
jgi:hypothetical protein